MRIDVSEDLDEAGGYAFIDLGRHIEKPFRKISIRRLDAEPRHLGVEEWQPETAWLEPRSIERGAASTVIRVGPEIVDRLEELVRVEIFAEGELPLGTVTWPAIAPSPGIQGSLALQAGVKTPQPSLVAGSDALDAAIQPVAELKAASLASEAEPLLAPTPSPVTSPPSPAPVTASTPPARGGLRWAIAVVLAIGVLSAGAAGFYYYSTVYQQHGPQDRASAGPSTASSASSELASRLETLLRRSAAPAALLTFGSDALAAGQPAVAFRAYEAADPFTSPEAAMQIAKFYDPRTPDTGQRAAAPNAARAITYYALWKNRSETHTAELKALCAASASVVAASDRLAAACRD